MPPDSNTSECKILWVAYDNVNFDFTRDEADSRWIVDKMGMNAMV
jgi:hypothetical protein